MIQQTQAVWGNHQDWLGRGFTEIIPVIPAGAELHEHSRVDPKARGKVPGEYYGGMWDGMGSWPSYVMDAVKALRYDQLGANAGLKMGVTWCALDVDITDDLTAQAMWHRIQELGGGGYFIRVGQAPKFLVLFKIAPGETVRRRQYPIKRDGETQRVEIMGVTAKGRPSQAVVAGTHPSGAEYQWNALPTADAVPEATAAQMDWLVEQMLNVAVERGWQRGKASNVNTSNDGLSNLGSEPFDLTLVKPVVDCIPNDDMEYDDWVALGYAIKNALGGGGWEIFEALSRRAPKNDPTMTKRTWDSFEPDGSSGFGKLVFWARNACGGTLPGDLDGRVKTGMRLQQAAIAGMPLMAPDAPEHVPVTATPIEQGEVVTDLSGSTDGRFQYTTSDGGALIPNMSNVLTYLMVNDMFSGMLGFDTFNNRRTFCRDVPFFKVTAGDPLQDRHYDLFRAWFQSNLFNKIGKGDVDNAVMTACSENMFDPLQDYVSGQKWDGVPRINSWLWTYCGVTEVDPIYLHYLSVVGRKWMIGAVARAMRPGCKMDNALIFEGPQGVGKSSALAALCPNTDWFGDSLPDFHHKDASEYLEGKWIVEMAELTQVHKGELENMRSFMSRSTENYRPAYGREKITVPRRCVFAGSTNRDDYLRDPAGERRFWIVMTERDFDLDGLLSVRDQLWAEAYTAYMSGESWHLDKAVANMAKGVQREKVAQDPWSDTLLRLLGDRAETSTSECFAFLGIDEKSRTTQQQNRLRNCLQTIGFVKSGRVKSRTSAYRDSVKWVRG